MLKGQKPGPCEEAFVIERSLPHGHVKAVLGTIRNIGPDKLIASRPSRQRDLVLAMIAERLLHGCSKLACTRLWHSTDMAIMAPLRASRLAERPCSHQSRMCAR